MSFTRRTLANRHAIWAAAIAISLLGVSSYFRLPMQLFPETAPPVVNVVTAWPGAAATDVTDDLSRVLEEEMSSLESIKNVRSTSQDNLSLVTLEFQYGRAVELAAVDVQNALARIRGRLPKGIGEPQVLTFKTSDRPVITIGVAADELVSARRFAEDVAAPRLQRTRGVAAVDVFGGGIPAVLVDADPVALEAHRVPLEKLAAALAASTASAPAGRVRSDDGEVALRIDGSAADTAALGAILLATPDGSRLSVGDVSTIRRGAVRDDSWFSISGERAIAVQVFKSEDANTVEVVQEVRAVVEELHTAYPEVRFVEGEESASFTELSIKNLLSNVWDALLLASVIIFLFLGKLRSSAVTIVSMPLSYALTFALMVAFGIELNMVTLTAVILAVGMVVDASIVVLENVVRMRDEVGRTAEAAAIQGTDEVLGPVLAGTLTTLVVLVPLLFLHGFIGSVFGPLALTLLLAFLSSVLVALVLVPTLTLYTKGEGRLDRLGQAIARPFLWLVDRLRDAYVGFLRVALRWRKLVVLVSIASFALGIVGMKKAGMDVLPKMDGGSFYVSLETPSGSSLEDTARVVREVERLLGEEPEVTLVQAQAGFEPGMKFSGGGGVLGPTQGFLTATLTPRTERDETIWQIEQRVRDNLARVPGIERAVVRELGNTAKATTTAPIVVRISGQDPLVLDRLGDQVLERLAAVPDVVEASRAWERDQERVRLDVDPVRAALFGTTPAEVARKLAAGTEGIPAGELTVAEGSPEPIRVRYAEEGVTSAEDLLDRPFFTARGDVIPVRSLASAVPVVDQGLATREDLAATLDLTAFVDGRPLSFVVADVEEAMKDMVAPEGYRIEVVGENEDLAESRGELARALAISILAVYLLLVAQFRSFLHPLIVMAAIPLSLSGVAAALHLGGKAVSMPVMVGLVLLVGTVVNSSIILVDFIRKEREAGRPRDEAVLDSVRTRFRPVMMTSLSTIVGMVPLALEWALGAERFSPLALATIGGMTTATFLTLGVIPVLYVVVEDVVALVRRPFGKVAAAPLAVALLVLGAGLGATAARAETPARLTLEEAEARAVEASPLVEARAAELEAALARQRAALSRFLPRVTAQLRYTRLSEVDPPTIKLPIQLPNGQEPDPVELGESVVDQYSGRLTVEQPLFAGGALLSAHHAASKAVDLAEARRAEEKRQAKQRIVEAYFTAAAAEELLAVADATVGALSRHEESLERVQRSGRVTSLDVERARSKVAEAEATRAEARAAVEASHATLALLLGFDEEARFLLIEPLSAPLIDVDDGDAPARADVRVAREAAEVADARAGVARGALFPQIGLRAGWQMENPNPRYFPVEDEWRDSWDASIALTWTVDLGTSLFEYSAARREEEAARALARAVEQKARLDAVRQQKKLGSVAARVDARTRQVETAERAAAQAHRLFEAGLSSSRDVLTEETELARARAELVRARVDERLERERLRFALGREER